MVIEFSLHIIVYTNEITGYTGQVTFPNFHHPLSFANWYCNGANQILWLQACPLPSNPSFTQLPELSLKYKSDPFTHLQALTSMHYLLNVFL